MNSLRRHHRRPEAVDEHVCIAVFAQPKQMEKRQGYRQIDPAMQLLPAPSESALPASCRGERQQHENDYAGHAQGNVGALDDFPQKNRHLSSA